MRMRWIGYESVDERKIKRNPIFVNVVDGVE
jgi:hypothetical protein